MNTYGNIPTTLVDRISHQKGNTESLDLSLCQITQVPLDTILSHYGKVVSLDLSYNKISCLPHGFAIKLTTMTKLDLSRNELKRLPENFGLLEQLVYLDCHQNILQTLPLSMGRMRRLKYLNLASNPFGSPICNILESVHLRCSNDVVCAETACIIIKFLSKLSHEIFPTGHEASNIKNSPSGKSPSSQFSKLGPQRQGMKNDVNNEDHITKSWEKVHEQTPTMQNSNTSSQAKVQTIWQLRGASSYVIIGHKEESSSSLSYLHIFGSFMALIIWIALFPFIMAIFFSSPYLENAAIIQPDWRTAWNLYKPYHEIAEYVYHTLQIGCLRPLYFASPPVLPTEVNPFIDAVSSMIHLISNKLNLELTWKIHFIQHRTY